MKFYCYYLIPDKHLYAWTAEKKLAKLFESQRHMDSFIKKTVELDKYETMSFMAYHKGRKLIDSPLYDDTERIDIVLTIDEDSLIEYEVTELDAEISTTIEKWKRDDTIDEDLKSKVLDYLSLFQKRKTINGRDYLASMIDTFAICYNLFHETFTGEELPSDLTLTKLNNR